MLKIDHGTMDANNPTAKSSVIRHLEVDFWGRPIKQGVINFDSEVNLNTSLSDMAYTRFSYARLPYGELVTDILPDCLKSYHDSNNELITPPCVADSLRKRTVWKNWLGQLLKEKHPEISSTNQAGNEGSISYSYDARGLLSSVTDPLGTTHIGYNNAGQKTSVGREENGVTVQTSQLIYDDFKSIDCCKAR